MRTWTPKKYTKEWSNEHDEKCFASSFKRREDAKWKQKKNRKSMRGQKNQKTAKIIVSPIKKRMKDQSQIQIVIRTVMFLSMKIKTIKMIQKNEEKKWIEYIRRSTKEAEEHMMNTKIPCWRKTHWRMKWRMALRTASHPKERWSNTIKEWNPGLDKSIKTNRPVSRRRHRWEDAINEFLTPEESEESRGNDLKNNDAWIRQAKK